MALLACVRQKIILYILLKIVFSIPIINNFSYKLYLLIVIFKIKYCEKNFKTKLKEYL